MDSTGTTVADKQGGGRRVPHLLALLLIWACIAVAFGRSLSYEFVWDDVGLIVDNPYVQSSEGIGSAFLRSFWSLGQNIQDSARSFYRPLITASYIIDHAIWGKQPAGFHLTNLIWHMFAAAAAYLVALFLLKKRGQAFVVALLFAIHPSHVENVCWISGRTDVFCTVFFLLAFLSFMFLKAGRGRPVVLLPALALCYVAALFSKETAVVFPLVALAYHLLLARRDGSKQGVTMKPAWLLLGMITVAYLFLRQAVLGEFLGSPAFGTPWERLVSVPAVFAEYLGSLFTLLPPDPHHEENFVGSITQWRFLIGTAAVVGYAVLFRTLLRRGARQAAFLMAWIPLTLLPTFRLGAFGDVIRADRFLYLPSLGFAACLVLSAGTFGRLWTDVRRVRILFLIAGTVLVTGWLSLDRAYSTVWRDNVTLFTRAAKTSPSSAYVFYNLGNGLAASGEHGRADFAYARALDLHPDFPEAMANRGISLAELGRHDEALECYDKALKLGDRTPVLLSNKAASLRRLGRLDEAIKWYRHSILVEPTVSALSNLGECYLAQDKPDLAELHFKQALDLEANPFIYNNLALIEIGRRDYEKALVYIDRVFSTPGKLPSDVEVALNYNMARCMYALHGRERARPYAMKTIELASKSPKGGAYLEDKLLQEIVGEEEKERESGGIRGLLVPNPSRGRTPATARETE